MSRPPTPAQPSARLAPIQRQARLRERLHPTHRNLRSELLATAAFLAPALALLAAFRLYPAAVSVAQSLQGGSLQAYRELFADTTFLKSWVTLAYAAMASPATVSLLLALVLQGRAACGAWCDCAPAIHRRVGGGSDVGMILDPHFGLANSAVCRAAGSCSWPRRSRPSSVWRRCRSGVTRDTDDVLPQRMEAVQSPCTRPPNSTARRPCSAP